MDSAPKKSLDAIKRRYSEHSRLEGDPLARKLALILAERDVVFFVNTFVWTYDPRITPSTVPFELFPDQENTLRDLWEWEEHGRNGILEKSRDMGASWLCAAYAVHRWLFRQGAAIGFGSRKLELVDKLGDPKSIFDKIRTIINNLPAWLKDERMRGYDVRSHDNFCKIINPQTGATITGEGGDDIGRGGRTLIYFVDEAAFLARPQTVDRALSANSRCIAYVSTPNGSNNPFAVKRQSKVYPVSTLHWRGDHRKAGWKVVPEVWLAALTEDQELILDIEDVLDEGPGEVAPPEAVPHGFKVVFPWYEVIKLIHDPITVAQEYDIDYTASLEGVIVPAKWLRACVGLKLPESSRKLAGFDVGDGAAEHVFLMRAGPVVKRIKRWKQGDPTDAAYEVVRLMDGDGGDHLYYDAVGPGSGVGGVFRGVHRPLAWTWGGINTGQEPTEALWPDKRRSSEIFRNLKAEMWWNMRVRAERTWRFVNTGQYFPPEELLSLPVGADTEALINQLANVTYHTTEGGLIIVESKDQLKDRGVASPDIAEALVLSFCPLAARTKRSGESGGKVTVGVPGLPPPTGAPIVKRRVKKGRTSA